MEAEKGDTKEKYTGSLAYVLAVIVFLIVVNGLLILIRAFALTANMDIGLYEDGEQNAFEQRIAINYIIDITEIVLFAIKINFALRLKREINQPKQVQVIIHPKVLPSPQPIVQISNIIQIKDMVYSQVNQNSQNNNYLHPLDGFQ